jgi:hypothetical protein
VPLHRLIADRACELEIVEAEIGEAASLLSRRMLGLVSAAESGGIGSNPLNGPGQAATDLDRMCATYRALCNTMQELLFVAGLLK